jgi:small subunit ribosomal protein S20
MANTSSAKKQILITERNHARNQKNRTLLKNALKKARTAITSASDQEAAQLALNNAVKVLYRSVGKGILKKQNAARRVGRIMKAYNKQFNTQAEA